MNISIETEYVEFKETTSQTSRALESIVAMLNKHGKATIYFGVDDKGEVLGLQIGKNTIKDLSFAITSRIRPAVIPTINCEIQEDKTIIVVSVVGNNKPYSADGNYLIRSGSENKKIDPELLKELVFSNSVEQIVSMEAYNQDLSFDQIKQLYISKGLSVNEKTFNSNLGLLCSNGKYNVLADLLSDNNNYSIKVVVFSSKDKSDMVVRNEYGYKCLLLALRQAYDYVVSLNETRVDLNNKAIRQEVDLFDVNCFREAWINACLHTKWSKQVPPVIYIYKDRMEIVSIGGLPVDYSEEDFYAGLSRPVNKQLQKIMGQLGLVEQTGHGVPQIVKKYGRNAFDIKENHITVTLEFPFERNVVSKEFDNLSENQKKVYRLVEAEPTLIKEDISELTKLGTTTVSKILQTLREEGFVERTGSRKNGKWVVKK